MSDVDLEADTIRLRERKRDKERQTMRTVPLSPLTRDVLQEWLAHHPGGSHTFCNGRFAGLDQDVEAEPMSPDEATYHLRQTLEGSRWSRVRGWHVLRHSFISNCVAKGIDQRIIDTWSGHQTDEMRRRYTHLLPSTQQDAIRMVFQCRASRGVKHDK